MDQKRPESESPDAAGFARGLPKVLVSVVVVVLAGWGVWQSQFAPVPRQEKPAVDESNPTDSIRITPKSQPYDESGVTDSPGDDSDSGPVITPRAGSPSTPTQIGRNPNTKPQPPPGPGAASSPTFISRVTLRDQDGSVIYTGPMDLQPTLDRIKKGVRDRHRNDGAVFQNREGRLPRQRSGYYHEYVVPTPEQSGPGPQRLILGLGGEVFYTADHYKSFQRLKVKFIP